MIIKCTYLREALKKYIKKPIYRCVLIWGSPHISYLIVGTGRYF